MIGEGKLIRKKGAAPSSEGTAVHGLGQIRKSSTPTYPQAPLPIECTPVLLV